MKSRRIGAMAMVVVAVLVLALNGGTATAGGAPRLASNLSGANEVPPADPDGKGDAKFQLEIGQGELCFSVKFDDTGTPNRAHIHVGEAGVNGGIVVPLFELAANPADPRHDALEDSRRLEGCVPVEETLLAQIAANPGGYYCNLHNARFPGGAIRGQLED
jgi:hypothetical protein